MTKLPDTEKFTNFRHTMIPAAPGTYVIDYDPAAPNGYVKGPIIAWVPDAENPYRAPRALSIHGMRRLIQAAILFPCGMVDDPSSKIAFADVDEWIAWMRKGANRGAYKAPVAEARDLPGADPEEEEQGNDPAETEGESDLQISWTIKSFKQQSFWEYRDEDYHFVFTLPPETNAPRQTDVCQKIKGTELKERIAEGVEEMSAEDVMEGQTPSSASPEIEPEHDDFDGADDLI